MNEKIENSSQAGWLRGRLRVFFPSDLNFSIPVVVLAQFVSRVQVLFCPFMAFFEIQTGPAIQCASSYCQPNLSFPVVCCQIIYLLWIESKREKTVISGNEGVMSEPKNELKKQTLNY